MPPTPPSHPPREQPASPWPQEHGEPQLPGAQSAYWGTAAPGTALGGKFKGAGSAGWCGLEVEVHGDFSCLCRSLRCVPGSAPTRPGQTREIEADERAPF